MVFNQLLTGFPFQRLLLTERQCLTGVMPLLPGFFHFTEQ